MNHTAFLQEVIFTHQCINQGGGLSISLRDTFPIHFNILSLKILLQCPTSHRLYFLLSTSSFTPIHLVSNSPLPSFLFPLSFLPFQQVLYCLRHLSQSTNRLSRRPRIVFAPAPGLMNLTHSSLSSTQFSLPSPHTWTIPA